MGRINDLIEQKWAESAMKFTPRILASYTYSILNGVIRQWIEPREGSTWERPSGTYCGRNKAFKKHGYPEFPFTAKTIRNFWLGDLYETTFVALALAAGVPIKYGLSDQISLNTVFGEGHPDGIIMWDPVELLEVKSMAPWPSYNNFKKSGNTIADLDNAFGYRNQICMYVDAAVQEGIIPAEGRIRYVAISKANAEISEKALVYDPDVVDFCRKMAIDVRASTSPFDLPALTPFTKKGQLVTPVACRIACDWALECWEHEGLSFDGGDLRPIEKDLTPLPK